MVRQHEVLSGQQGIPAALQLKGQRSCVDGAQGGVAARSQSNIFRAQITERFGQAVQRSGLTGATAATIALEARDIRIRASGNE